jgi:uncharacterized protein YcfL
VQLVGIQIYNLDIARIKNQRNEKDKAYYELYAQQAKGLSYRKSDVHQKVLPRKE